MCAKAYETGWGGVVFKTIGPKHFVIREVSPRFDALRKEATPWIGFKNMEQIAEHSLEDNLRDLRRLKRITLTTFLSRRLWAQMKRIGLN